MSVIVILGWLPVIGVAAGLARARFRRAPWIAAGVVVLAYLVLVGSYGGYAATCWDCSTPVSRSRGDSFYSTAILFGVYLALTLLGIVLGARFSSAVGRLIATFREARRELFAHNDP
jgi:hypothetical protein